MCISIERERGEGRRMVTEVKGGGSGLAVSTAVVPALPLLLHWKGSDKVTTTPTHCHFVWSAFRHTYSTSWWPGTLVVGASVFPTFPVSVCCGLFFSCLTLQPRFCPQPSVFLSHILFPNVSSSPSSLSGCQAAFQNALLIN